MNKLAVDVVAPEGTIYAGPAQMIVVPGVLGEIGIMPRHEPILTMLREGTVRIFGAEGGDLKVHVQSGYVSVDNDQVVVLPTHYAEAVPL